MLNRAEGLARCNHNAALYRRMLQRFEEGQAQAPQQIRAALVAGDRAGAERLAHTLKGLAGTIGAAAAQQAAAAVEAACREGQDAERLEQYLHELEQELAALMPHLAAALAACSDPGDGPSTASSTVVPTECAALAGTANSLWQKLQQSDTSAADALALLRERAALQEATAAGEWEQVLREVEQALARYDFPAAAQALEPLLNREG